jgi:hypothetical protein
MIWEMLYPFIAIASPQVKCLLLWKSRGMKAAKPALCGNQVGKAFRTMMVHPPY